MSETIGNLSETEIDELVTAQADDESAWDEAVYARARPASVSLPAELAARAAFLARLHHAASLEEWLQRIVQERVNFEEAALAELRRELALK